MIGEQSYHSIVTDKRTIDDILNQIRTIREFPCTIKLYDRAFVLSTKEECWTMMQGIEIGAFIIQDTIPDLNIVGRESDT